MLFHLSCAVQLWYDVIAKLWNYVITDIFVRSLRNCGNGHTTIKHSNYILINSLSIIFYVCQWAKILSNASSKILLWSPGKLTIARIRAWTLRNASIRPVRNVQLSAPRSLPATLLRMPAGKSRNAGSYVFFFFYENR